ncbi:GPI ethanolamine phosphate transferase 3 [Rhynchospora pubera]|uniref:GPI ethanolamine phosphate transferase 3 n=1 Tax=Rhynchospora pubera TaxID=906938 RepID=A0AAV8GFY5_9POAL|nr:GPI ethanolamine phosphate transferase 3 [Rhynchospora pubera]
MRMRMRLKAAAAAVLCLHCLGVYLFTRGFLLTRTELSAFSLPSDLLQAQASCCSELPSTTNQDQDLPGWTPPTVERVLILIVDALRFDFVAPSSLFQKKQKWMDRLPSLQHLASTHPSSSRIFKAIADPPTTSLQRLKALTTGGLPTFIDVGNSFAAPAIQEDNWIHQLVHTGRRVVMMGDDTWTQLFPHHFNHSYPYPSFNVKDLHTVDNGVAQHLVPWLHRQDWDVLIGHFLGVDHAGHIFGVDSQPMVQKLEQINAILQNVTDIMNSQKHLENTMLIVMGDHAQTLNGDHGGGTSEEVETCLFAWMPRSLPSSISSIFHPSTCGLGLNGKNICTSTMQQLDFAVSISALLGIPFPFGSIGRVNPELYALSPGSWDRQWLPASFYEDPSSDLKMWKNNYAHVLCINSWQVKRYIDSYSATSVMGFPSDDLHYITKLYNEAQSRWSDSKNRSCKPENGTIDEFSDFLLSFATLARSAWTEFDMKLMGVGLGIFIISIIFHLFVFERVQSLSNVYDNKTQKSSNHLQIYVAFLLVAVRAVSFLSNSYILAEGRVANFLLATTAIGSIRSSLVYGKIKKHDLVFLILIILIRFGIEKGMSKQAATNPFLNYDSGSDFDLKWLPSLFEGHDFVTLLPEISPMIILFLLSFLSCKYVTSTVHSRCIKWVVTVGTMLSYLFIATFWLSERSFAPKMVYVIGLSLFVLNFVLRYLGILEKGETVQRLRSLALVMVSAWSPTILILLGKQGPFVVLVCIIAGWSIISSKNKGLLDDCKMDPISVMQWSLLAICLFYQTGHWCTFDGLRYGAAFIGFDEFKVVRQAILLFVDTFGISHILPIFSLPFLVTIPNSSSSKGRDKTVIFLNLTQVYLLYGLITAITTTFTVLCVAIQRRHLMVWGLFAPKYVFDAISLLLTDVLICVSALYYC